jgi:hypothetical protein
MTPRTWLITGVNSGFGRHMTEQLLDRGDRVAGSVRKLDSMNGLTARYGDRLWLAHLDVTDAPAIRRVVDKAFADLGKIDVVVNNAGYPLRRRRVADGRTDQPADWHESAWPDSSGQGGPPALTQSGRRPNYPALYLWRTSRPCGRVPLSCKQVGNRRLLRIDDAGTRTFQNWRYDCRAGRRGYRVPESRRSGRSENARLREHSRGHGPRYPCRYVSPSARRSRQMVRIMIDSVDQNPAPKRIALGSDAYAAIHRALMDRLADLEAQKDLAFSADLPKA